MISVAGRRGHAGTRRSLTARAASAARRSEMSTICEMNYCGAPPGPQHDAHPAPPRPTPVGAHVALLGAVGVPLAAGEIAHRDHVAGPVVGVGVVADLRALMLVGLAAEHRGQRRLTRRNVPSRPVRPCRWRRPRTAPEALLGLAQGAGLLWVATTARGVVGARAAQEPAPATVGVPEAQLDLGGVAVAGRELAPRRAAGGPVVRVHEARTRGGR